MQHSKKDVRGCTTSTTLSKFAATVAGGAHDPITSTNASLSRHCTEISRLTTLILLTTAEFSIPFFMQLPA